MDGFSWVENSLLSASPFPLDEADLRWLREQGVDILLTLTPDPVPRRSVDQAGLMSVHVPIDDMQAPTFEQLEQCIGVIEKARESRMAVNVHCLYGQGRTGTILAAYLISQGFSASEAIKRVRELRPGSIESYRQEESLHRFAASRKT